MHTHSAVAPPCLAGRPQAYDSGSPGRIGHSLIPPPSSWSLAIVPERGSVPRSPPTACIPGQSTHHPLAHILRKAPALPPSSIAASLSIVTSLALSLLCVSQLRPSRASPTARGAPRLRCRVRVRRTRGTTTYIHVSSTRVGCKTAPRSSRQIVVLAYYIRIHVHVDQVQVSEGLLARIQTYKRNSETADESVEITDISGSVSPGIGVSSSGQIICLHTPRPENHIVMAPRSSPAQCRQTVQPATIVWR